MESIGRDGGRSKGVSAGRTLRPFWELSVRAATDSAAGGGRVEFDPGGRRGATGIGGESVAEQVISCGPAQLEWDGATRFAVVRFVEAGVGGRVEAETLSEQLRAWVGDPAEPYDFLVDCSEMVDVDASWRAIWGEYFREHNQVATLSWFNANPRIQLLILMFLKGTGIHGKPFEHEVDARAWLAEQRVSR